MALRINAFVIMPTHLHLIAFDAEFNTTRLDATLTSFRKYTGRRLADYCDRCMPTLFRDILVSNSHEDRTRHFWQESRHPEAIFSQPFWQTKVGYLHDNPRRKGLVLDPVHWRFSSAAFWLGNPAGYSDVVLTPVAW